MPFSLLGVTAWPVLRDCLVLWLLLLSLLGISPDDEVLLHYLRGAAARCWLFSWNESLSRYL